MLRVENIRAGYQEEDIILDVSLQVNPGEIVCVIGPNGAGKSTLFQAIYGFAQIRQGQVLFDGQDITNWQPQQVLKAGMALVPQQRSLFPQMSVMENLEIAMYLERNPRRIKQRIEYVFELFPQIAEKRHKMTETMSGGELRMLEIGRALMLEPKMAMLDEPSAGLAPQMAKMIFENIRRLNQELGLTVLMIEQNASLGLTASHRGYVLQLGKNAFEGTARALLDNPDVRRAFLGA